MVVSQRFYANFHSIDKLRQVLLSRRGWRDPLRRSHGGISPEKAIGSWEGGAPALDQLPGDEIAEGLLDACAEDNHACAEQTRQATLPSKATLPLEASLTSE